MVRAFTISFDYEGKTYLALASMRKGPEKAFLCSVRMYDDKLYRLIPGGVFSFTSCPGEVSEILDTSGPEARKLADCISRSVTEHLRACGQA